MWHLLGLLKLEVEILLDLLVDQLVGYFDSMIVLNSFSNLSD